MRRVHRLPVLEALVPGVVLVLSLSAGCEGRGMKNAVPDPCCGNVMSIPQSAERSVDVLFVIDNSDSMAGQASNLRFNYPALHTSLRNMVGGLPDVHVGVTTADLGAGVWGIPYCDVPGGDGGALLTGSCANPTGGQPYIIDVAPAGCPIQREMNNLCTSHSCAPVHCEHEPSTILVEDSLTGCPRCRNYEGESFEDVASCITDVGDLGCGFDQPLEAMYQALDPGNPVNAGFLRENAFLAVIFVTSKDDCSAESEILFDPGQTTMDSTLGPFTSFRCFEFGVTCDINDRAHEGTRQGCVPNPHDVGNLIHPVTRYIERLRELKDPQMLVVAALAGPVTPSPTGIGHNVVVGRDVNDHPAVVASCTTAVDEAVPAIRLFNVVEAFSDEANLVNWAYSSICSADYTPALAGIGNKIKDKMEFQCLPHILKGCSDPGVEYGAPQAQVTCEVNAQCLATCEVVDVFARNTDDEIHHDVYPCLEYLPDGTRVRGNTDRFLAYADGHPDERDPALPVTACWHIRYQPACAVSNYAQLVISRREDPPPRSFANVACMGIEHDENMCNDGRDNNENCLSDRDDPWCQGIGF